MSTSNYALKLDPERVKEMPMVDLAFEVLKAANTPFYYRDLIKEIANLRGLTEEQFNDVIAHVYTEINIDGRFACVGTNMWGLKRWYPVERSEDPIANSKRPRIINDEDDDEDLYADEEEDTYTADEDYDSFDEDSEDIFEEGDDEEEVDDEVVIDDEDLEDEEVEEELDEEEEELEEEEEEEEADEDDEDDR